MSKKVVIVGAGPGGLTTGMLLAQKGYQVEIFEQKDYVGGRNGRIELGDFKFDIGPTFLMLTKVLEEVFEATGRDIHDYLDLKEIEPLYRLRFRGAKDFFPTRNREKMRAQIKKLFRGDEENYDNYLEKEKVKFEKLYPCLRVPYHKISAFFRPHFWKAIPYLDIRKSLYERLSTYFKNDELRLAMTFQSKYLGMSPWQCPATFTILSYIEHNGGIFHTTGGLNAISEAMAKVIAEDGGKIHLSRPVKEIIVEKKKAKGVVLEDGEQISADYVVINADFAHAMTHLVDKKHRKKYTNENLERRDYSCSTFMLYLGVDKIYDINHHNIIFADDYQKNVKEIAVKKILSKDPSIYIHNPSLLDPTLAPEGKSSIYVLVPVPNNSSKINWEKEAKRFRDLVIHKIKTKTELKDIEDHIVEEKIISPWDWEEEYSVYKGATFNLSHKISQMLYMRPHNKFEEFKNCFLVGGGTHPGSGLPTIYESARISADLIMKEK